MRQYPEAVETGQVPSDFTMVSRREFLRTGAVLIGAGAGVGALGGAVPARDGISIGIFTDSHYADRKPGGNRCYRDSSAKLAEFVAVMNEAKPDFAIVLGDFVDKGRNRPPHRRKDLRDADEQTDIRRRTGISFQRAAISSCLCVECSAIQR